MFTCHGRGAEWKEVCRVKLKKVPGSGFLGCVGCRVLGFRV